MSEPLTKVEFSNLGKILFPESRITKGILIEYFIKIAPRMLEVLANRPLSLTRFPNGITKQGFYEKNAPEGIPSWVKTIKIHSKTAKRDVNYILCNDLDTLIWLANLAAIEIHVPLYTVNSGDKPDLIFFDLDPEPPASIEEATKVALVLKEKLDKLGLRSFVKTSGKKGLHVLVPIARKYSFNQTRLFAHKIGQFIANENEMVVSEFSETKKPGRVFIDYLQNSQGRTMVCPYSLRASPAAPVSTPLDWDEVKKGIKPAEFNIFTVPKRERNPWKEIFSKPQKLEIK